MNKLHLPLAYPDDRAASESQVAAITAFYAATSFGSLTSGQAGDLLDYRDFARAIVRRLARRLHGEEGRAAAEPIAIHISRHREIATGVVAFMRKRFDSGADPDNLHKAIGRLAFYEDLEFEFEGLSE